jgi:hypothetical protein
VLTATSVACVAWFTVTVMPAEVAKV